MHVFLISLPDPADRRNSAIEKLRAAQIDFEIVDGVEAKSWRKKDLPLASDAWPSLSATEVGCYLAHLRALRRLLDYDLKWACVLEDDFCFEPDPDIELAELEPTLPRDFHYLHLQRDLGIHSDFQVGPRHGLYRRIVGTPLCTAGYVITRPLAEYVLEHHQRVAMPIDHLYSELSHRGRFYVPIRPLIGIDPNLGPAE
jgi:glycosyl transferase family 25